MKKIYYIKEGRRYVPMAEYDNDLMDSFTKGNHLVMSYPGGTSRRFNIDPNYAAMIAAGRLAEDAISKTIMEASALRVSARDQPLTQEQLTAWQALAKTLGREQYALEWCSYREAAEAGVKAMQDEADKLLQHEAVRQAYDHFMFVAKLAYDEDKKIT